METFFVSASVLAGGVLALQAGANAQLSKALGSPFGATTLQLLVGTAALSAVALATGATNGFAQLPQATWWHAIGGIASAIYVVSTILLFPRLGAVVSVGLFIAGQMLISLGIDTFGWFGVAAKPLTPAVALGTAAVLAGAAAIVVGQKGGLDNIRPGNLGWIALALGAGAVLPVQGAVNALLRADIGAPFAVATVSFVVATLSMTATLAFAVGAMGAQRPAMQGIAAMPWWGWLGGFAGAAYVTTMFTAMPAIGAATTVGLTVAGQQVASMLVDRFGWFRLPQRPISALRLLGVITLLGGVVVVKLI